MKEIPVKEALVRLKEHYPDAGTGLQFKTPWQLLIATILAAQANDKTINAMTPELFERYPGPEELSKADTVEVEKLIRRSGSFHQKTERVKAAAQTVLTRFAGQVPRTMDELVTIPGVARKTANIVMSNAFKNPQGIAVDTHVLRVCFRTGLSMQKDALKMENELMEKIPRDQWGIFENRIKAHGQNICQGKKPLCDICFLNDICPKHPYVKK